MRIRRSVYVIGVVCMVGGLLAGCTPTITSNGPPAVSSSGAPDGKTGTVATKTNPVLLKLDADLSNVQTSSAGTSNSIDDGDGAAASTWDPDIVTQ